MSTRIALLKASVREVTYLETLKTQKKAHLDITATLSDFAKRVSVLKESVDTVELRAGFIKSKIEENIGILERGLDSLEGRTQEKEADATATAVVERTFEASGLSFGPGPASSSPAPSPSKATPRLLLDADLLKKLRRFQGSEQEFTERLNQLNCAFTSPITKRETSISELFNAHLLVIQKKPKVENPYLEAIDRTLVEAGLAGMKACLAAKQFPDLEFLNPLVRGIGDKLLLQLDHHRLREYTIVSEPLRHGQWAYTLGNFGEPAQVEASKVALEKAIADLETGLAKAWTK